MYHVDNLVKNKSQAIIRIFFLALFLTSLTNLSFGYSLCKHQRML